MPDMQSARLGLADAELSKADGLFAGQNTQTDTETQFAPSADERVVQAIRVELSERGRKRGGCVSVAACHLAEVESASSPICKLARKLLHSGVDARTPLSIWRGRTKCFHDMPVDRWAEITVEEGGSGTVFRRYKPYSGWAVASQMGESDD